MIITTIYAICLIARANFKVLSW